MDPDDVPLVLTKSNLFLYVGKALISQYFQICVLLNWDFISEEGQELLIICRLYLKECNQLF